MLERNPELEFQEPVDLDQLVKDAFVDFQKDRSRLGGSGKLVRADLTCESFQVQEVFYARLNSKTNNILTKYEISVQCFCLPQFELCLRIILYHKCN